MRELDSFFEQEAIELMEEKDLGPEERFMSSKWVLCTKEQPDGSIKYKARLAVKGYEDQEKGAVLSDAPTVSKTGVRVILQTLVQKQWRPRSMDYSNAFLKGTFYCSSQGIHTKRKSTEGENHGVRSRFGITIMVQKASRGSQQQRI